MDNFVTLKSSLNAIQNIINLDIVPAFDDLSNNSQIFNDLIISQNEIQTELTTAFDTAGGSLYHCNSNPDGYMRYLGDRVGAVASYVRTSSAPISYQYYGFMVDNPTFASYRSYAPSVGLVVA